MNKHLLLVLICVILLGGCYRTGAGNHADEVFTIGLIADVQYADKDDVHQRKYRSSRLKLQEAVDQLNTKKPDMVFHVGDFMRLGKFYGCRAAYGTTKYALFSCSR